MENKSDDEVQVSRCSFLEAAEPLIPFLKEARTTDAEECETLLRRIGAELPGGGEILKRLAEAYYNGEHLALLVQDTAKTVLDREDLDKADKEEALADAEELWAMFHGFREASHVPRGIAFQFASLALLTGLRAGLRPDQVKKIRGGMPAELGRGGGKRSGVVRKAKRRWVTHATELAKDACSRDSDLSIEKVAGAISDHWKHKDPRCPGMRTLETFVSNGRKTGQLPQRTGLLRK
jgi:hypothetical protein